ncbi:MAG: VOC family protein [Firmicutes bacterium]|nr:VOC family protein [Bacillota bacterium]
MAYHQKPATYVGSVRLRIANLERSLQFYQQLLGFKILEQDSNSARLTADGKTEILSLIQLEGIMPKQERRAGLYHFAILLPDRSDLAQLVNHLAKGGMRFGSANHLVSEAIYFDDPDGNGIEIYADTPPSTWIWSEAGVDMSSKPLDFDDLLRTSSAQKTPFEMPEQTIIGHIHLHVSNLQDAEKFYTAGLGFEVVHRFRDNALFLSTKKYHHHIAMNTWNGVGAPPTPENSVGLDYFTLIFPTDAARQDAISNLRTLKAAVHVEGEGITVKDPSGNSIKLSL